MNERIEKLVKEAGLSYVMVPTNPYIKEDLAKLAELIVKECADWIDDQGGHDGPCGNDLKEHFVVKE